MQTVAILGRLPAMRWAVALIFMAAGLECLASGAVAAAGPQLDREALSAAIFDRTNRERVVRGLKPLQADKRLAEAADGHARFLSLIGTIQHNSFLPGRRTVFDRVAFAGLTPRAVSENLALTPLQTMVLRSAEGGEGRIVADMGKIDVKDIDAIAEKVVQQWMESPPHRADILSQKVTHLGCAVETGTSPRFGLALFSVQVFARL